MEGRNSKRIIDRMARPVAAFQRFTASGTTSISLRQSLPSCLPACLPAVEKPWPRKRALLALSASSWPKSKPSIADRERSDDQRTCGTSLIRGPMDGWTDCGGSQKISHVNANISALISFPVAFRVRITLMTITRAARDCWYKARRTIYYEIWFTENQEIVMWTSFIDMCSRTVCIVKIQVTLDLCIQISIRKI